MKATSSLIATALLCMGATAPSSGSFGRFRLLYEVPATPNPFSLFLSPVERMDDLDGDGVPDLALGVAANGGVEVLSGATGLVIYGLPDPGFPAAYGAALSTIEDLDGDGTNDLVVGAAHGLIAGSAGYVELRSGIDGALLLRTFGELDTSFGEAVETIQDLDGDGLRDVVVGTPQNFTNGPTRVEVVSSATGAVLRRFEGTLGELLGASLANLGDLDGDGLEDVAAGSPFAAKVTILSGADFHPIRTLTGPLVTFGHAVANAGDLDGDGLAELAVSFLIDDNAQGKAGRVFVYRGSDGSLLRELVPNGPYGAFGAALTTGHVDADAVPDLIVGQSILEITQQSLSTRGAVLGFSGADGSPLFQVLGEDPTTEWGNAVAFLGRLPVGPGGSLAPVVSATGQFPNRLRSVRLDTGVRRSATGLQPR